MSGPTPANLWQTVREGKLIQVFALYAGVSFFVLEAVGLFTEQLGLPDWVFPGATVLLLMGLPIILATAYMQGARAVASRGSTVERAEPATETPPSGSEVADVARKWLTWRRAIMGGFLAFALLALSVGGYMAMRSLGIGPVGSLVAAGVLSEREPIVLADFQSSSGDAALATIATEAFRIDLAQSELVSLMPPDERAAAMRRMDRDPGTALHGSDARELAIREGLKAVIAGDIARAGSSFAISVELLSAESGQALVAYRETARDSADIMPTIDDLSKKLRERVGESLRTIRRNEPLAQVTTGSLEALLKYSQGTRALYVEGDQAKGIALLEEAIGADSLFAMACRELGITLYDSGERARGIEQITRAYENRERLTDRERYHAVGTYFDYVRADRQRAATAYRTLLDTWPDDARALHELASLYASMRDYARAEELLRRGAQADSFTALCYPCLVQNQVAQGKFDDAEKTVARFAQNVPGNPVVSALRALLYSARGDLDRAEAEAVGLLDSDIPLGMRANGAEFVGNLLAMQGRLTDGERYFGDAMSANDQRGLPGQYLQSALALASVDVHVRRDPNRALRVLDEALERHPLDSTPVLDMPYLWLADVYSWSGRPDRARALLETFQAQVPRELRGWDEPFLRGSLGVLALAEERPKEAISELRALDAGTGCAICPLADLGRAYDAAGMPDSAIAVYERYVEIPVSYRVYFDGAVLPGILERLGELYEERGDAEKAIYYYGRLTELWKGADPELQPRVQAARRAIAALSSDR